MKQKFSCRFLPVPGRGKVGCWWGLLLCGLWWYGYQWSVAAAGERVGSGGISVRDTLCFFGEPVILPVMPAGGWSCCRGWSEKKVERFYRDLYRTDFRRFLNFCTIQAKEMCLGDWGYYLLVERAAAHYFPGDTLSAAVFTCFMMRRSGYECTLTCRFRQHWVACYVCTVQRVDYRNHLYRRGMCYSQVCGTVCPGGVEMEWSEIESKTERRSGQKDTLLRLRALDLRMSEAPFIGLRFCERQYRSYADDDSLVVFACYNPQHLAYYAQYPFTTLDVYFNTPLPVTAAKRLKEIFIPRLSRLTLFGRVNYLLHYVQFAYSYETDHAQFGKEKYNFAEESLCYDATDCDDRSVLYAVLLRLLVPEVEVVGLNFPLHVCTAVSFPDSMEMETAVSPLLETGNGCFEKNRNMSVSSLGEGADFIEWKGRRYYVADPTYVGADVGEAMPVFRQMRPEVIEVMPVRQKGQ